MPTFRPQFTSKFLLKHHMAVILLGTGFSGVLANRWLFHLGLDRILVRYPLAVILSYLAFLFLMRIWLTYISRVFKQTNLIDEFDDSTTQSTTEKKSDWGWDGSGLESLPGDEPCGCLILVFLFAILGIFIIAFLLIAEAPLILAETAFQFLLAAGLIRTAKKIDRPDWVGSVLARTWKPFAVILFTTLVLGSCAEISCSNPTTIKAVIQSCDDDKK